MAAEPVYRLLRRRNGRPRRDERALNHDHREAERAGSFYLGHSGIAARVLCQNSLDAMFPKQPNVVLRRERAARLNEDYIWKFEGRRRQVYQPYDIGMLWRGLQFSKGEAPNPAEDDARFLSQSGNSRSHVWDAGPIVTGLPFPCWALHSEKGCACDRSSFDGVAAHLGGKGVGGVDQDIDTLFPQITDKPFNAAEPAASCGNRLGLRRGSPARKGKGGIETAVESEQPRQRARFRGAAEEKNAHGPRL